MIYRPWMPPTILTLVACACCAGDAGSRTVSPKPWYRIYNMDGYPRTVPLFCDPASYEHYETTTPAQSRAVSVIQCLRREKDLARMDEAFERYRTGVYEKGLYGAGWGDGAGLGINIDPDGYASFGHPFDGLDALYPEEAFRMPLAEFLPLYRDWAASQRLWNRLLERHGVPDDKGEKELPKEFWPRSYPPETEA